MTSAEARAVSAYAEDKGLTGHDAILALACIGLRTLARTSAGGYARAAQQTPQERREAAQKAVRARWAKRGVLVALLSLLAASGWAQEAPARPKALVPLYLTLAGLQAADLGLTRAVLNRGGVEGNALMRPVVGKPLLFAAVKAGVTGLTIASTEALWRNGHRKAAVGILVGHVVAYGLVVRHNAGVLRGLQ